MTTTESYGCDKHGEDAYQGCAMCDLERLTAENAALRKDAERYRFMREHTSVTVGPSYVLRSTEELDSAIDAAMEQGHE